ncbi:hypothetical protein D3C72_1204260 [compost metagenome]
MRRSRQPNSMFGHSSVSRISARLGWKWPRKRLTLPGTSYGRYTWSSASPHSARTRSEPVGVMVVMTQRMSGRCSRSALTSGAAALTSPTETACSQTRGWPLGCG